MNLKVPLFECKCGKRNPGVYAADDGGTTAYAVATCHCGRRTITPVTTLQPVNMQESSFPPGPGEYFRGAADLTLGCPLCRALISLEVGGEKKVDDKGHLTPSVICPFGCGFHAFVILVGEPQ